MEFIKPGVNFDFVGKRKLAFGFSLLLIIISVASLVLQGGPNYGVDFAGGVLIQAKFTEPVTADQIRSGLKTIKLDEATVQTFGDRSNNEFLIRAQEMENLNTEHLTTDVTKALSDKFGQGKVTIQRVDMVGPKVGADLREKALAALFAALLLVAVYISGRFELKWFLAAVMAGALGLASYVGTLAGLGLNWLIVIAIVITVLLCWYLKLKYALGAIVALIHDVIITVGMFSLTGKEFTLTTVAALLAIIGYSLNDTIIVFDRIRETRGASKKAEFGTVINRAINGTLSRTVLTSGTTLLVVVALLVFGGGVIHDFAFALTVGVIVGTYSSIFVASPVLLLFPEAMSRPSKPVENEKPVPKPQPQPQAAPAQANGQTAPVKKKKKTKKKKKK